MRRFPPIVEAGSANFCGVGRVAFPLPGLSRAFFLEFWNIYKKKEEETFFFTVFVEPMAPHD